MIDPSHEPPYIGADELSEEDWAMVHQNFLIGAQELDALVGICKEHIEGTHGACSGPWCAPPEMIGKMELYTSHQLALLLHQAIYRLAMQEAEVRIGGEAG